MRYSREDRGAPRQHPHLGGRCKCRRDHRGSESGPRLNRVTARVEVVRRRIPGRPERTIPTGVGALTTQPVSSEAQLLCAPSREEVWKRAEAPSARCRLAVLAGPLRQAPGERRRGARPLVPRRVLALEPVSIHLLVAALQPAGAGAAARARSSGPAGREGRGGGRAAPRAGPSPAAVVGERAGRGALPERRRRASSGPRGSGRRWPSGR